MLEQWEGQSIRLYERGISLAWKWVENRKERNSESEFKWEMNIKFSETNWIKHQVNEKQRRIKLMLSQHQQHIHLTHVVLDKTNKLNKKRMIKVTCNAR
jgi:hypothetical protein